MSENGIRPRSLFLELRPALLYGRASARAGKPILIGGLINSLGPSGLPFVAFLLALPFAWPLSLGPIATPVSLLLLIVSIAIARGAEDLSVAEKYRILLVPRWLFQFMRRAVALIIRRVGLRRLGKAVSPGSVQVRRSSCAWGMVVATALLAVPIPILPLTNTFPALGIMAFALGCLDGNPARFRAGVIFSLLGIMMFAIYAFAGFYLGVGLFDVLRGRGAA